MSGRLFCVTDFERDRQFWVNLFEEGKVSWCLAGDEICPKTGNCHWQMVFYRENKQSVSAARKMMKGRHVILANGNVGENVAYCSKEKFLFEYGKRPNQGARNDLMLIYELIKDGLGMKEMIEMGCNYQACRMAELALKYLEQPRKSNIEMSIYWFWGSTGSGKTKTAAEMAPNAWWSGKSLKWFEGYDAHDDVIIDDFRGDFCTFHELLRLLDRYEMRVENKGGSRQWKPKRIFITCPFHPEDVYLSVEDKGQLLRRITEIRLFGEAYTGRNATAGVPTLRGPVSVSVLSELKTDQKSGGNTVPPTPNELLQKQLSGGRASAARVSAPSGPPAMGASPGVVKHHGEEEFKVRE